MDSSASHHAEMLAAGWEGGRNLLPLVVAAPERFTADLLRYTRATGRKTRTLVLTDEPPYVYVETAGGP